MTIQEYEAVRELPDFEVLYQAIWPLLETAEERHTLEIRNGVTFKDAYEVFLLDRVWAIPVLQLASERKNGGVGRLAKSFVTIVRGKRMFRENNEVYSRTEVLAEINQALKDVVREAFLARNLTPDEYQKLLAGAEENAKGILGNDAYPASLLAHQNGFLKRFLGAHLKAHRAEPLVASPLVVGLPRRGPGRPRKNNSGVQKIESECQRTKP